MGFQISPGINVSEIDLTTIIPAVGTTVGAVAGPFRWGPAEKPQLIDSELTLKTVFAGPNNDCANNWFNCANFLSYAEALQTVRVVKSGSSGHKNATSDGSGILIKNEDQYLNTYANGQGNVGMFAAKYAGDLGNSLAVSIADVDSFGNWAYKSSFDSAPNTSASVLAAGGLNDEMHIVVIDTLGLWTGTAGTVLERFPFVSKAVFAKAEDGSAMYYPVVLNRKSKYVWWMDHPTDVDLGTSVDPNWGSDLSGDSELTFDTTSTKVTVSGAAGTFLANETIADAAGATVTTGSGAVLGTPVIGAGGVLTIPVTAQGTGYLVPPNVVISGDGDGNAAAVAVLGTGGTATHVVSITVTVPGANYTTATASITSGSGATATVTLGSGSVTGFSSLVGGTKYTSVPTVAISGDGTGATAHAVLTSGVVSSLVVDTPGSGYTSATVAITAVGSGATAGTVTFNTGKILSIGVTSGGSGYLGAPTVLITSGSGSGAAATATVTSGVISSITVTNGGSSYAAAVATIVPVGSGATASVTIDGTGRVTALTPTAVGSGYTVAPTVVISGPGSGADITAHVVSGQVTSYTVNNGGHGYTTISAKVISYGSSVIVIQPISGHFAVTQNIKGLTSGATATVSDIGGGAILSNLSGGVDANALLQEGEYINGYDTFRSGEDIDVSLILTGDVNATVQIYIINNIVEFRKDCVAFLSPPKDTVVDNTGNEAVDIVAFRDLLPSTSYAVMDSGWKYQYDKYADIYRWVPLNGDIAGLCVRTDTLRDPWWSPAGYNRGFIKNVVRLAWNPRKAYRDLLYQNGVNPVMTEAGQGTLLFGDKTLLSKPSAFDRINVRRLFIVLEKAISTAAKFTLFEFNDQFTRAQFVNMVEPYLRDVKGRRGIADFRVVCDDTNNTPEVIDSNRFVGDLYIVPAHSINFIQLNFVAVRTGVNFEEIVGKF